MEEWLNFATRGPHEKSSLRFGGLLNDAIAKNHDHAHRGVENRTPREAFLRFAAVLKNEALTV